MMVSRFRRRLLVAGALLACACLPFGWAEEAAPRIACDGASFDFGEVMDKERVDHTFVLKNAGGAELVINKVTTSCGCTTASLAKKNLAPGESVDVAAKFSLKGRSGHQKKTISVHSNDPVSPLLRLQLCAHVRRSIEVSPPAVGFGRVGLGLGAERKVTLSASSGTVFRVMGVVTDEVSFCDVRVDTVTEGAAYAVTCNLRTNAVPTGGAVRGRIVVNTDHPLYSNIVIRVSGVRDSELVAIPSALTFQKPGGEPAPVTRYVLIRSGDKKPIEILKVNVPLDTIGARVERLSDAAVRIKLSDLVSSDELNGKEIEILVRRWNGEERTLRVPIRVISR